MVTSFEVESSDTIDIMKAKVYEKVGMPVNDQIMIFARKKLGE